MDVGLSFEAPAQAIDKIVALDRLHTLFDDVFVNIDLGDIGGIYIGLIIDESRSGRVKVRTPRFRRDDKVRLIAGGVENLGNTISMDLELTDKFYGDCGFIDVVNYVVDGCLQALSTKKGKLPPDVRFDFDEFAYLMRSVASTAKERFGDNW